MASRKRASVQQFGLYADGILKIVGRCDKYTNVLEIMMSNDDIAMDDVRFESHPGHRLPSFSWFS